MEMGEELRYCLPGSITFAWIIGAVGAVLNAFFSRATTQIACLTTRIYVVRLTATTREVLFWYASETGDKLISVTCFVVHSYRARTAIASAVCIRIEHIYSLHLCTLVHIIQFEYTIIS